MSHQESGQPGGSSEEDTNLLESRTGLDAGDEIQIVLPTSVNIEIPNPDAVDIDIDDDDENDPYGSLLADGGSLAAEEFVVGSDNTEGTGAPAPAAPTHRPGARRPKPAPQKKAAAAPSAAPAATEQGQGAGETAPTLTTDERRAYVAASRAQERMQAAADLLPMMRRARYFPRAAISSSLAVGAETSASFGAQLNSAEEGLKRKTKLRAVIRSRVLGCLPKHTQRDGVIAQLILRVEELVATRALWEADSALEAPADAPQGTHPIDYIIYEAIGGSLDFNQGLTPIL